MQLYGCEKCGKCFLEKENRDDHFTKMHVINELEEIIEGKTYVCKLHKIHRKFNSQQQLQVHQWYFHGYGIFHNIFKKGEYEFLRRCNMEVYKVGYLS